MFRSPRRAGSPRRPLPLPGRAHRSAARDARKSPASTRLAPGFRRPARSVAPPPATRPAPRTTPARDNPEGDSARRSGRPRARDTAPSHVRARRPADTRRDYVSPKGIPPRVQRPRLQAERDGTYRVEGVEASLHDSVRSFAFRSASSPSTSGSRTEVDFGDACMLLQTSRWYQVDKVGIEQTVNSERRRPPLPELERVSPRSRRETEGARRLRKFAVLGLTIQEKSTPHGLERRAHQQQDHRVVPPDLGFLKNASATPSSTPSTAAAMCPARRSRSSASMASTSARARWAASRSSSICYRVDQRTDDPGQGRRRRPLRSEPARPLLPQREAERTPPSTAC